MTDKALIVENFVRPLQIAFGDPKTTDPGEFFDLVCDRLRSVPAELLRPAANWLIDHHEYKSWPTIAVMQKAVAAVRPRDTETSNLSHRGDRGDSWSTDSERQADELVRCDLGRTAAAEGWILTLHDFARERKRLPSGREIDFLREKGRRHAAERAEIIRGTGNGHEVFGALRRLALGAKQREERLTQLVADTGDEGRAA